ncbi:MAG: methylmalonyl-CoA epimerase [Methanobacteriota archaeon]
MIRLGAFDHVGVAVVSLAEGRKPYDGLGLRAGPVLESKEQRVRVQFLGAAAPYLELLEPTDAEGPVARFLAKRGPGLHHVAYRVPDLRRALADLAADGVRLIDTVPRTGAAGHPIAFLHPESFAGVLVELVEHP